MNASSGHGGPGSSLTPAHHHLYRLLLQHPASTKDHLALEMAADPPLVQRLLRQLHTQHLAVEHAGAWDALQPPEDLDARLASQQDAIAELRAHHEQMRLLQDAFHTHGHSEHSDGIELVATPSALLERLETLQANVRHTVRGFDREPHYTSTNEVSVLEQESREGERLRAGVDFRVIYEPSMWDNSWHAHSTMQAIAAGEQARIFPRLPMKLYIFDEERAVVPLDPVRHSDGSSLIIHPSGLLHALVEVFDIVWSISTPITGARGAAPSAEEAGEEEVSEREHVIISMLAAGASDSRIMHQLGISRSTVTRTIGELCERLHVTTRYQLGAESARRGWI